MSRRNFGILDKNEQDRAMIDTPWGRKRWRTIREAFEQRDDLVETLRGILCYFEDGNVIELRECGCIDEIRAAIAKAEGKSHE